MSACDPLFRPLQERSSCPNHIVRVFLCTISVLISSLLVYRATHLPGLSGLRFWAWLVASLCEAWFSFVWVLVINEKWHFIQNKTFPENLLRRFKRSSEFPPIDVFITTADPAMEPSIITINTVLSVLAVDYPPSKMACYISDDACSPLTFYSLLQASNFAKSWVSFCKKYEVKVRAPFRYFSQDHQPSNNEASDVFHHEWLQMKRAYEELTKNIAEAIRNPNILEDELSRRQYFQDFANIQRGDHPSVIKVIHVHEEARQDDHVAHLIYVSREKRPWQPLSHFKAGAMNVLTRVSGVMTNAPFMLNLDCDMFVNNHQAMHHALCLLLGFENETRSGFVQFPQVVYDGLKDDPFGNQLKTLFKYIMHGMEPYQGTMYAGTGCFHRRKIMYGLPPSQPEKGKDVPYMKLLNGCNGSSKNAWKAVFGLNEPFIESALVALFEENAYNHPSKSRELTSYLEAALHVSTCDYELKTGWGKEVGWCYGTIVEDVLTGLRIHSAGWRSVACFPDPPAFLGSAPSTLPVTLLQHKRWATGLLEIAFHPLNPIDAAVRKNLQVRECLGYFTLLLWAARSLPESCYVVLPALCIIMDVRIYPKANDPAFLALASLFVTYNMYTVMEYLLSGLTVRAWWNNQRMHRIKSATSWLFGLIAVILKNFGISETVFELTNKDDQTKDSSMNEETAGKFVFDSSAMYIPATTMLLINMIALVMGLAKVRSREGGGGAQVGELVCCVWMVLSFLPFLKGFFRRGRFGLPWRTTLSSAAVAALLLSFSKRPYVFSC